MYGDVWSAGLYLPLFILGAVVWILALIHIWNDADELYGTGWFWMVCVLLVPPIAIPAYWLMKLGTHRNWKEELAALDREEHKRDQGQRFSGQVFDIQRRLQGGTCSTDEYGCVEVEKRVRFRPFRPTFAASAERLRQRIELMSQSTNGIGATSAAAGEDALEACRPPERNQSSQGCGDRPRDQRLNERMSWRASNVGVRSRWASPETGTAKQVAGRNEVPF